VGLSKEASLGFIVFTRFMVVPDIIYI